STLLFCTFGLVGRPASPFFYPSVGLSEPIHEREATTRRVLGLGNHELFAGADRSLAQAIEVRKRCFPGRAHRSIGPKGLVARRSEGAVDATLRRVQLRPGNSSSACLLLQAEESCR